MIKKLLLSIVFTLTFFTHSYDMKETKQLNKIHANPFNDSYIVVFNGSPESFSLDKITIDKNLTINGLIKVSKHFNL